MKKHITDEELIDLLSGELSPESAKAIKTQIDRDEALRQRWLDYRAMQAATLEAVDERPSAQADLRFAEMLAQAQEGAGHPVKTAKVRFLNFQRLASIAAAVLLVFSLGWYFGQAGGKAEDRQLLATRSLMEELMKDDKTSARIEATAVTMDVAEADTELLGNLGYLLNNDPNANVRLAALSALQRFPDNPQVRMILLDAMESDLQEVVRLQLLETLVRLREEKVIPYLEKLIENDSLPRHLHDAAMMGKFKLI